MDSALGSADLVAMFEHELRLCQVKADETVLIFTDPRFPHPEYPPAAFAAARSLGADAYIMVLQGDQQMDDALVRGSLLKRERLSRSTEDPTLTCGRLTWNGRETRAPFASRTPAGVLTTGPIGDMWVWIPSPSTGPFSWLLVATCLMLRLRTADWGARTSQRLTLTSAAETPACIWTASSLSKMRSSWLGNLARGRATSKRKLGRVDRAGLWRAQLPGMCSEGWKSTILMMQNSPHE